MIAKIDGFCGAYSITSRGFVISNERVVSRKNSKCYVIGESIKKTHLSNSGYKQIDLYLGGVRKKKYIHRLVAEAFIDRVGNKKHINHIDGNKLNNNIDNLEWCDRSDNIRHAIENGLSRCHSETHYNAKLDNNTVREIRRFNNKYKLKYVDAAYLFDISPNQYGRIVNLKRWKNV